MPATDCADLSPFLRRCAGKKAASSSQPQRRALVYKAVIERYENLTTKIDKPSHPREFTVGF